MAPFGDSPTVGIGGITLGGGIGPLQRTVGLVSDNLIGLKMVDAKGRVIRASKKRNTDLYGLLRAAAAVTSASTPSTNSRNDSAPEKATVYRITWPWDQFPELLKVWQRVGAIRGYKG